MKCPRCRIGDTLITHLRTRNHAVTRLRRCKNCQHKFLSYETLTPPANHGLQEEKPASEERMSVRRIEKLRRIARREASDTGRDYRTVCAELDVPLTRRMTAEELAEVRALGEKGMKAKDIAAKFNRHPGWIYSVLRRGRNAQVAEAAA